MSVGVLDLAKLVYRVSIAWRTILIGTLAMWIGLLAYIVAYTGPPGIVIFLFSLPVLVFVWLILAANKPTVWEVDAESIRRTVGGRQKQRIILETVSAVEATGGPDRGMIMLRVRGLNGKSRMTMLSSPVIGADDIRFLYQAIAEHAERRGIPVTNTLGWSNEAPRVETRGVRGERAEILTQFAVAVPLIMIVTGMLGAIVAALRWNWTVVFIDVVVTGAGGALLFLVYRRLESRRNKTSLG